jgi:hypothetical protein
MRRQIGLVESRIAAHKQAVYVLPARVANCEALAHLDTGCVSAEFEANLRNPIDRLYVLHLILSVCGAPPGRPHADADLCGSLMSCVPMRWFWVRPFT